MIFFRVAACRTNTDQRICESQKNKNKMSKYITFTRFTLTRNTPQTIYLLITK